MTPPPTHFELINNHLALAWPDGSEAFLPASFLRQHSPSAANIGEKDIFGTHYGPNTTQEHPDVTLTDLEPVGNYALQLHFSDGHNTGIYSWQYLQQIINKFSQT